MARLLLTTFSFNCSFAGLSAVLEVTRLKALLYRPVIGPRPLTRLKQYGWNRRILTMEDFERFCERENIIVITQWMRYDLGRYYIDEQAFVFQPVIVLHSELGGPQLVLTAFHEAGHHCWHAPGHFGAPGKAENEAEFAGLVALMPKRLLLRHRHRPWEICEEYGYEWEWVERRYRILRNLEF